MKRKNVNCVAIHSTSAAVCMKMRYLHRLLFSSGNPSKMICSTVSCCFCEMMD